MPGVPDQTRTRRDAVGVGDGAITAAFVSELAVAGELKASAILQKSTTLFEVDGPASWKRLLDALMEMRDQGGKWTVKIEPWKKIRTPGQNSRFWAGLTELLNQIHLVVLRVSAETGYTPLEIKRLLAKDMPTEHGLILFAHRPEIAHEVLKEIAGIPTSARLGTKEFSQYDEQMEQVIAEIMGEINAFERRAA